MCGIAAIFATDAADQTIDRDELLRIRDHMVKRGPDSAGLWLSSDARVGLAHRRLAIIDLSPSGAQPMASSDESLHIVFNGEIYNHRALRLQLQAEGVVFRSHSDTEVLLALYRRHGLDMLQHLRGMFAFALWDGKAKGLLLARDHFGIKPLYLSDDGKTVRVASQVKALLAGRGFATSADPAGHAGFFLWGHVPEPHTLYREIRPLPAGSWLWVGMNGERRQGRFFDMATEMRQPSAVAPRNLHDALLESVRYHLEADVDVGVFLSSGLDSTTLLALTAEARGTPPQTLTLGFSEFAQTAADEVPLAELAARHYNADHRTFRVTAQDFRLNREKILADMDQPSIDGINTWFIAQAAAQRGLKVALSGLGGDELFAGYNSFHQIPALVNRLSPLARLPFLGTAWRRMTWRWIGRLTSNKAAGLFEYGVSIPRAYLLRRAVHMPWELGRILDHDAAEEGLRQLQPLNALESLIAPLTDNHHRVSILESSTYMRNQLLRDADWAGMAHSMEIRTPLVDVDLFRAVQAWRLAGHAATKQAMAACANPPLPSSILNRPKTGFFVPVAQWLGQKNLRGWAQHVHQEFMTRD